MIRRLLALERVVDGSLKKNVTCGNFSVSAQRNCVRPCDARRLAADVDHLRSGASGTPRGRSSASSSE
jgi:hypothetical protein